MEMLWLVIAIGSFPFWETAVAFIMAAWKAERYDYNTEKHVEIALHKRLSLLALAFLSAVVALCLCYPILLELNILEKV